MAGLRKKVGTVIAKYVECIFYNRKQGKAEGFLNSVPKKDRLLETYHVGSLPLAKSTDIFSPQ